MISHISVKNVPTPKNKHSATSQNVAISCVTPQLLDGGALSRTPYTLGGPSLKPSSSHPGDLGKVGSPWSPPRTGALLIIISCESPDWVSDADLPGVSLSAGDTRTLVCCFWKKRWTIKIDLYENQNYLYMEFIGLWLNLGWWMIWICLLDIQLKPNLPSACWCKPQVLFIDF